MCPQADSFTVACTMNRPDVAAHRRIDLTLLVTGVAVLWAIPHGIFGDGEARYTALERLLTQGDATPSGYSMIGPLFATPLYLAGRLLGEPARAVALLNVTLFTIALVAIARELRHALPPPARRSVLLLLVYGSMFPAHVQAFYGEVFTALAITLGVLGLSRDKPLAGWTAIILGGANTPATIVGVVAIAVRAALRTRRWMHLLAPLVMVTLISVSNLVASGSLLLSGYEGDKGFRTVMPYSGRPGFSYPLFFGALSIFLSFGKGLVFFAPGLFAPLERQVSPNLRWAHGTLLWFVAGLVVVYAQWWAWYGGWFWGPRFFLMASVPAALALGSHLGTSAPDRPSGRNLLLAAALALSFWVGVNGIVFGQNGLDICSQNDYALEALCHFTPELSVLWHPFVDFASSVSADRRPLAIAACAFWAFVLVWTARGVFASLARDLHGAIERTRR